MDGSEGVRRAGPWYEPQESGPIPEHDCRAQPGARAKNGLGYSFDYCVPETVVAPALFVRQKGDAQAVSPEDIQQDRIGECVLASTLASLAATARGRAHIESLIKPIHDASGRLIACKVTLFDPMSERGDGRPSPREVEVKVGEVPVGAMRLRGDGSGRFEMWPQIIERAVAKVWGGYDSLNAGTSGPELIPIVTGRPAAPIAPSEYSVAALQKDLAAGKVVIVGSSQERGAAASFGMAAKHAYTVTGLLVQDGRVCVQLRNPWGHTHPKPIPFESWSKAFHSFAVES